MRDCKLKNL